MLVKKGQNLEDYLNRNFLQKIAFLKNTINDSTGFRNRASESALVFQFETSAPIYCLICTCTKIETIVILLK